MNFGHFLLAIFLGRFARFVILSLLTIRYGKDVVSVVGHLFSTHLHLMLGIVGAAVGIGFLVRQIRRRRIQNN
jgi:membrane protein DedA with SNARE-associated domain